MSIDIDDDDGHVDDEYCDDDDDDNDEDEDEDADDDDDDMPNCEEYMLRVWS